MPQVPLGFLVIDSATQQALQLNVNAAKLCH
jgi:hypothetical protein